MKENHIRAHMKTAYNYAELSYCKRKQVGCVIVKSDKIISIGFNGTPTGWENTCEDEHGCTRPEVLHAESNALMKLAKGTESGEGATLFTTCAPCFPCAKLIAQAGIREVFYAEEYVNSDGIQHLEKCKVKVTKVNFYKLTCNCIIT